MRIPITIREWSVIYDVVVIPARLVCPGIKPLQGSDKSTNIYRNVGIFVTADIYEQLLADYSILTHIVVSSKVGNSTFEIIGKSQFKVTSCNEFISVSVPLGLVRQLVMDNNVRVYGPVVRVCRHCIGSPLGEVGLKSLDQVHRIDELAVFISFDIGLGWVNRL